MRHGYLRSLGVEEAPAGRWSPRDPSGAGDGQDAGCALRGAEAPRSPARENPLPSPPRRGRRPFRCRGARRGCRAGARGSGAVRGSSPTGGIGLQCEIAFGVEAHRAVVEIGRADPQDGVVDDHDLGVDVDGRSSGGDGMEDAEAIVPIRSLQVPQQQRAGRSHDLFLEPPARRFRIDEDDLGAVHLLEPPRKSVGDLVRGEILALEVEKPACPADAVEVERLDLAGGGLAVMLGLGAGDADLDILEGRLRGRRPRSAPRRPRRSREDPPWSRAASAGAPGCRAPRRPRPRRRW